MKIDLTITHNGEQIDLDFSECKDIDECLDVIVETVGKELDSEFIGYYEVNKRPY